MIGYRFLTPAEEEMTEGSKFYEAASRGLGFDFLDDVQQTINRVCEYPEAGKAVAASLRRVLLHRFPFSIIYSSLRLTGLAEPMSDEVQERVKSVRRAVW